jgi:hypothetical protein
MKGISFSLATYFEPCIGISRFFLKFGLILAIEYLTFHFLIYSFLALYIQPKNWQAMESFYAQILGTCKQSMNMVKIPRQL